MVRWAEERAEQWQAGSAGFSATRRAAEELLKIARDVEPRAVVEVSLALYLMAHHGEPRRFQNDRSISFQLCRRVRALTDRSVGRYGGRRVSRDLPPRVTEAMAEQLKAAFATAGLMIVHREQTEEQRQRERVDAYHAALSNIP